MITVSADTRLLQARLLQVAKGVKGGIRKAVADSAGRIGMSLARDTFPITERGSLARKERMIFRVYPSSGTLYAILKKWNGGISGMKASDDFVKKRLQLAKLFARLMSEGRTAEAAQILNQFPPFRATSAASANEATFRALRTQRTGAGNLSKNGGRPQVFWRCVLVPEGPASRASLLKRLEPEIGRVANGWVVSSRHFRAGRSSDFLPKFKTRKQKIVTGAGSWEGSDDKPVAVLTNTYKAAFSAMKQGAGDRAIKGEIRNLEKQLVNQAKFAARKARLGT